MLPVLAVLVHLFLCAPSTEGAQQSSQLYTAAHQPVVILKASAFCGDAPFAEQTTAATVTADHVTPTDHSEPEPPRVVPHLVRNDFLVFAGVNHRSVRHPLHEASLPPPASA